MKKFLGLLLLLLAVSVIICAPWAVAHYQIFSKLGINDVNGDIASAIDNITNPMIGLLSALLVYYALMEQVKANRLLMASREEDTFYKNIDRLRIRIETKVRSQTEETSIPDQVVAMAKLYDAVGKNEAQMNMFVFYKNTIEGLTSIVHSFSHIHSLFSNFNGKYSINNHLFIIEFNLEIQNLFGKDSFTFFSNVHSDSIGIANAIRNREPLPETITVSEIPPQELIDLSERYIILIEKIGNSLNEFGQHRFRKTFYKATIRILGEEIRKIRRRKRMKPTGKRAR